MVARNLDWKKDGACRTVDTNIFFPDSDDAAAPALAICARCPVQQECLNFALTTRQHDGVWGGATETQRRQLYRRRSSSRAA